MASQAKKDEELWNKILLVVEVGDLVRFKYGKSIWKVLATRMINGKHWIKVMRARRGRFGWATYTYYKEVWQGTCEYKNMRIVKPHGS